MAKRFEEHAEEKPRKRGFTIFASLELLFGSMFILALTPLPFFYEATKGILVYVAGLYPLGWLAVLAYYLMIFLAVVVVAGLVLPFLMGALKFKNTAISAAFAFFTEFLGKLLPSFESATAAFRDVLCAWMYGMGWWLIANWLLALKPFAFNLLIIGVGAPESSNAIAGPAVASVLGFFLLLQSARKLFGLELNIANIEPFKRFIERGIR